MNEPYFIETMRVESGLIANFERHIRRMKATCEEVFGCAPSISELEKLAIPAEAQKLRIVYGRNIRSIEFGKYSMRNIRSLKMVEVADTFDYHLKFEDRSNLNNLLAQKGDCDDVLIVKDGYITDTSFSNVVFTDGMEFVTPKTWLLPGTMRGKLLEEGLIREANLKPADIVGFTHIALINAMLPLGNSPLLPIECIV